MCFGLCVHCVRVCMCVCVCVCRVHPRVCHAPAQRSRCLSGSCPGGGGGEQMCGGCFIRGSLRGVRGMSGPPRVIGCLSSLCVGSGSRVCPVRG